MSYLITGSAGDIAGQWRCRLIAKSCSVSDYKVMRDDTRYSVLLHLAAKHPVHNIVDLVNSNISYLQDVIDKTKNSVELFVFMSSTSVYGVNASGHISEECCGDNMTAYGMSKRFGELLVGELRSSSLSLRCPAILEQRNSNNLLSKIFDKCIRNEPITLNNARLPFNAYVSVEQLEGFVESYSHNAHSGNQIVNVASNADLCLADIVEIIRMETKSNSSLSLTTDVYPLYSLDISKAQDLFDYQPGSSESLLRSWCRKRLTHIRGLYDV